MVDVGCTTHGRRRGFIVCKHVANEHAAVAHFVDADADELGEVLCAACHQSDHEPAIDNLLLVCADCVATILGRKAS